MTALVKGYWNEAVVMTYLEYAASIHRRLPAVRVPAYYSLWPETIRDEWQRLYDGIHGHRRLGPPMPPEVSFHEEVMAWLVWVERYGQQIVWTRANQIPWKILVEDLGRSKPTLWRELQRSLRLIAAKLEASDPDGTHFQQLRGRANGFA